MQTEIRHGGPRNITECMNSAADELWGRYVENAKQWPLVKRNKAITKRNEFMKRHAEELGIEYKEMPLEQPTIREQE